MDEPRSGRIRPLLDGRGGFAQLGDFSPSLPTPVAGATLLWSADGTVWSALGTIPPGICNGADVGHHKRTGILPHLALFS